MEGKKSFIFFLSGVFLSFNGVYIYMYLLCFYFVFDFQEILVHNVGPLLHTVPFFANACEDFIDDIVSRLRFVVFLSGEYICKTGRKGDKMYFIQRGIVDVLTKDGTLATSLGDGSHFGGKVVKIF